MENELFHVLNRGVDKRQIFMDEEDHFRFIHDLYEFNDKNPANTVNFLFRNSQSWDIGCPNVNRKKERELLVKIHAFAMMPSHYHLLLSPVAENGISLFMKKLNMGYAKYFNEKNKRVGALFQGKYKSIHVSTDSHFLHLPFYIHFNPLDMIVPEWRKRSIPNKKEVIEYLKNYRWSSHLDYLGIKNFPSVIERNFLLDFFEGTSGYAKTFEKELKNFSVDNDLGALTLERD
jgi:putative transposase